MKDQQGLRKNRNFGSLKGSNETAIERLEKLEKREKVLISEDQKKQLQHGN